MVERAKQQRSRREPQSTRLTARFPLPLWIATFCWLLASFTTSLAQSSVTKEYQIKAAYLYNFAKFVEWPAQSFTNSDSPLVIGVYGQNPFGTELEAIAKDHQINGRHIVIKMVATPADTGDVNLLFIGSEEDGQVSQTLAALGDADILTVGESEKFAASGGMIQFIRDADKVRFSIDADAAERHGLKISAQLLKLAASVHKKTQS
jgi:hypothetical protein